MKADMVFTHIPITDENLKNRLVVMVDVLRTSTSICVALKNKAKEIIPVSSVPDAMELAANLSRDNILLCGEREGRLIDGFDLGNSPFEYSQETVSGKSLIFSSTNGSVALIKSHSAYLTIVCGFVNVSACLDFIMGNNHDLLVVCAGNNDRFALEDAVCGGFLIHLLQQEIERSMELNDGAEAAVILYQQYNDRYYELLQNCSHGRYLTSLNLESDLRICAEVDSINLAPIYKAGKITLSEE